MQNRWGVLGLLFLVRTTMAFQFEAVAAISPVLQRDFGVGLGEIGTLIGLYLLPGVVIALPGGAVGRLLGDRRSVLVACSIMFLGNTIMAFSDVWAVQIAARLLSGSGGVILNVITSKMVADWFAQREMSTAMALFLNSWPFGIAVALLVLPPLGIAEGYRTVFLLAADIVGAAALLFGFAYKDRVVESPTRETSRMARPTIILVTIAGLIWGLFNTSVAMIFSFGINVMVEQGWTITAAGSLVSLILWVTIFMVPLGGFAADRIGNKGLVITVTTVAAAVLLLAASRTGYRVAVLIAFGVIGAFPAGAMMSLPASVLKPHTRVGGMAVFYTIFYITMGIGPVIAGALASYTGRAATAFDFGAALLLACPALVFAFTWLRQSSPAPEIAL
jgi:MFS family permease